MILETVVSGWVGEISLLLTPSVPACAIIDAVNQDGSGPPWLEQAKSLSPRKTARHPHHAARVEGLLEDVCCRMGRSLWAGGGRMDGGGG